METTPQLNEAGEGGSQHPLVRCWSCSGSGIGSPAILNTAHIDIPCDRCKGTGECPEIMKEWTIIGSAMRAARLATRMSLREWATARNIPIVDASRAERGLIDPLTLPANAEVRHGGKDADLD